jgi:hypothetical protein
MIKRETSRNGHIVDGQFVVTIGEHENIFEGNSPEIKWSEKVLDELREALNESKKKHILAAFREEIGEYEEVYGSKPTLALLNYYDMGILCDAYNDERKELQLDRNHVYTHSDEDKRRIDGVKVKQGCDQEPSFVRFYQFE